MFSSVNTKSKNGALSITPYNKTVALINFITALFLLVAGLLMIVSAFKSRKRVFILTGKQEHSKNSLLDIIVGTVAIITGIIALLLYLL